MSFGDRVGLAGIVLALIALAASYLWPDKKWIGWISLFSAVALLIVWGWLEIGAKLPRLRTQYPTTSAVIAFVVGGCLLVALWQMLGLANPTQKAANKTDSVVDGHIEFVLSGGYRNFAAAPEQFVIHVGCSIDNKTGLATGLTDWKMLIKFKDGNTIEGVPPMVNGDLTVPLIGYNEKQVYFRAADYLPIKTMQPIPAWGATYGWYWSVFKGVTKTDVRGKGAILVIEFRELASGRGRTIERSMDSPGREIPGMFREDQAH
jgi:hypothetical protein